MHCLWSQLLLMVGVNLFSYLPIWISLLWGNCSDIPLCVFIFDVGVLEVSLLLLSYIFLPWWYAFSFYCYLTCFGAPLDQTFPRVRQVLYHWAIPQPLCWIEILNFSVVRLAILPPVLLCLKGMWSHADLFSHSIVSFLGEFFTKFGWTGFQSVTSFSVGDGRMGYAEEAPYDAIHVGAAAPVVPQAVSWDFIFFVFVCFSPKT